MMSDVIHDAPAFVANRASWYEASARQRIDGLLDAGSFTEFLGPAERVTSPHLPLFALPQQFAETRRVAHASPQRPGRAPDRRTPGPPARWPDSSPPPLS